MDCESIASRCAFRAPPKPKTIPMMIPKASFPLALVSTLFAGSLASAQTVPRTTTVESVPGQTRSSTTETETTTTTTVGTVAEMGPDVLTIRTESAPAPIRYASSASTVFVDETGQPVAREIVTSGLPVTVHYSRVGDRMIADRVVVRRQTSTTTTGPTVIEKNTTITRPPVVVEKPVPVEKKVYVDRPVEKKVYVDRP